MSRRALTWYWFVGSWRGTAMESWKKNENKIKQQDEE